MYSSPEVSQIINMVLYQHSKRIYLVTILVMSFVVKLKARNPQWQGIAGWEYMDAKEQQQKSLEEYECTIDGQCEMLDNEGKMIETNEVPFKRRVNVGLPTIPSFDMDTKSAVIPFFHTSQPFPCSCNSQPRLHDLGPGYHPRYLPTAVCNAEACGGGAHRCHQRLYKVRVLTRRDANNPEPDPNSALLPESLRKNWMFKTFTVTVACECHA